MSAMGLIAVRHDDTYVESECLHCGLLFFSFVVEERVGPVEDYFQMVHAVDDLDDQV
jgi:hypothetical protein